MCVPRKVGQCQLLLMSKELRVHFPSLPLLLSTAGGFGGFEGVLMNRFEGEVADNVFQLPGLYIFCFKLRQRLTDVSSAVGSLKIRELDQRELGILFSSGRCPVNVEDNVLWHRISTTWSGLQKRFDLL